MKLDKDQQKAVESAQAGLNVVVLGPAGHGKSAALLEIIQTLNAMHGQEEVRIVAMTNENALAMGGVTLHSFLGIPVLENGRQWTTAKILESIKRKPVVQAKLRSTKSIVADELPSWSASMFECLLMALQVYAPTFKGRIQAGGGCQIVGKILLKNFEAKVRAVHRLRIDLEA